MTSLFNNSNTNKLEQTTQATATETPEAAGLAPPPPSELSGIDTRLHNIITSVCGPNDLGSSVVGYDVLCLGRASKSKGAEVVPTQQRDLPIRLLIRIKRESSLGGDWPTCTRMAHACYEVLQEEGINDVHCLVFEADTVTYTQDIHNKGKL